MQKHMVKNLLHWQAEYKNRAPQKSTEVLSLVLMPKQKFVLLLTVFFDIIVYALWHNQYFRVILW